MRKLIILLIVLIILDVSLFRYLINIESELKPYKYNYSYKPILVKLNDIKLQDINDFKFSSYFEILSLNDNSYRYSNDEDYFYITIDDINTFKFKYILIEPEVIKETIYIEKIREVPINNENIEYEQFIQDDYFNLYENYLSFPMNTSLDVIREKLKDNVDTSYETSIDYSKLNTSVCGVYEINYITEKEIYTILVEIV